MKIREEAEEIVGRYDSVVAHGMTPDPVLVMLYKQSHRVLILLDALEEVQKHVVGLGVSKAIKQAEEI